MAESRLPISEEMKETINNLDGVDAKGINNALIKAIMNLEAELVTLRMRFDQATGTTYPSSPLEE